MTNCRLIRNGVAVLLSAAFFYSCDRPARISVEIKDAPSADIVIRQQNVNRYDILDTVRTDASGHFSFKVKLEKGDPDFIYLYKNDRKIASVLLASGDKVRIEADTLGNYNTSGSEESGKLMKVEKDYAGFNAVVDSLAAEMEKSQDNQARVAELSSEMARTYTDYYRKCVRYVMENSKSLTVIPVFYQTVSGSFYVFSQNTDALHFKNVADSLSAVYPESRYVRALKEEAESRTKALEMQVRLRTAEQIGFLDLDLPDTHGKKVRLSDLDSKAVLLYFWSPADAVQKMFNLDVLKGIYGKYRDKGLEIYQVAIATDKPSWERVISAQGLEWINVCDGLGEASPVIGMYNLRNLPAYYLIVDGQLSDKTITDAASLKKALAEVL